MKTLTALFGASALLVTASATAYEPTTLTDMWDPYVLAEDIDVREEAPMTTAPAIGSFYDTFPLAEEIDAGPSEPLRRGPLFDQWDPYFGTGGEPGLD